mgnify:CR=1 FL=1
MKIEDKYKELKINVNNDGKEEQKTTSPIKDVEM